MIQSLKIHTLFGKEEEKGIEIMFIINVVPILRITLSLLQSSSFKSECFYILFYFSVVGENDKSEGSGPNAAAVAVPVVLLLLLIPAVVFAVFFYRR